MSNARSNPTAAGLLNRRHALLAVVDLQERLLPAVFERDRVVENTLLLIRAAKAMSVPVALTTQYARGLGAIVPEILAEAGVTPIDKTAFGCFGSDAFLAHLTRWPERKQLLVAGVESHICVTQTVLGAIAHGYAVHVAGDATSSRTEANWKAGLHRMEQAGAVLSTAEMAIYELLARSDDAAFKAILPLLKG